MGIATLWGFQLFYEFILHQSESWNSTQLKNSIQTLGLPCSFPMRVPGWKLWSPWTGKLPVLDTFPWKVKTKLECFIDHIANRRPGGSYGSWSSQTLANWGLEAVLQEPKIRPPICISSWKSWVLTTWSQTWSFWWYSSSTLDPLLDTNIDSSPSLSWTQTYPP